MRSAVRIAEKLHQEALAVVQRYQRSEIDLIEILQRMDARKAFYSLGFKSLYIYARDGLGLADAVAYTFVNVARKSVHVPELKAEIKRGTITVTKAKKISGVINKQNAAQWIELAKTASKSQLEKEVAKVAPATAVQDKLQFVNAASEIGEKAIVLRDVPRVQLQVGISEQLMLKIRRAQDIVSQKKRKVAGLEAVLEEVFSQYLEREDPVKKAERQKIRGKLGKDVKEIHRERKRHPDGPKLPEQSKQRLSPQVPGPVSNIAPATRKAIPASLKHEVIIKYNGQCGSESEGRRCPERRLLEIHHLRPVSEGGGNELENLKLLCAGHHRQHHAGGP